MAVSCGQVANHVLLQARDIAAHAHDGKSFGKYHKKTIRDVRSRVSLIVLQQMYNIIRVLSLYFKNVHDSVWHSFFGGKK